MSKEKSDGQIRPDCLKAGKAADRNWKDGGQQKDKVMKKNPNPKKVVEAEAARGQAIAQRALDQVYTPRWYQFGPHFNIWTLGSMIAIALLICYCTNTYPWINGVFKL